MFHSIALLLCFVIGMHLSAQPPGGPTLEFIPNRPLIREADITKHWRIWREIDLREKMNQVFYYPLTPNNGRKNFITTLRDAVLIQGSITPFDAFSDDFMVEISRAQVAAIGTFRDTIMVPESDPPYELKARVIEEAFRSESVKKIWLKEDWVFDRQHSVMEAYILGLCPVMQVYDRTTGEFRYNQPMFWVYFPQTRYIFAQEEVYNPNNFGQRLSYDDVFKKRIFSSKIRKVNNVHDRGIEEYLKGIHALLRGEEIKNELFLFEHDMWEQ
jgi:gliding motility associated protien GldN